MPTFPPPNIGSAPVLSHEALARSPRLLVPLPMSYSQMWLPLRPGQNDMSGEEVARGPADTLGLQEDTVKLPQSHRNSACASVTAPTVSEQRPAGLSVFSTSKQKQRGHVTLLLKTGCWLQLGVSTSLSLDIKSMTVKASGLHSLAQLCSTHSAPQK